MVPGKWSRSWAGGASEEGRRAGSPSRGTSVNRQPGTQNSSHCLPPSLGKQTPRVKRVWPRGQEYAASPCLRGTPRVRARQGWWGGPRGPSRCPAVTSSVHLANVCKHPPHARAEGHSHTKEQTRWQPEHRLRGENTAGTIEHRASPWPAQRNQEGFLEEVSPEPR